MKRAILFLTLCAVPSAMAAQAPVTQITGVTASREALRTQVNTRLSAAQSNFTEIYTALNGAPWLEQTTAPNTHNVFWIDTSGASPAIKYWDGDSWEVAASGGDGTYTLPVGSIETLGGVKDGAGVTIAADGTISADDQLVGDCTAGPCLDGTSDGGNYIKLWAGTGSYWTALQGGSPAANRSWRLPIAAPPSAGSTYLMNMDEYGQMGFVATSTFLAPTGSGAALTIDASGFDGNLTTSDNTLQEVSQKVDDLIVGGGGYANLTEFVGQTAWRLFYSDGSGDVKELSLGSNGEYLKSNGAALAPSWATPSGAAHDAVTLGTDADAILGLSTQQITLDSQPANTVLAAPNGSAGDPTFRVLVEADIPASMATDAEVAAGYQPLDADLTDLADGSLTGSKVGTGVDGGNISTGTVVDARIDAAIARDTEITAAINALPNLIFGTGLTTSVDTPSDGTDTISVTANTYQAYDADWLGITANGAALISATDYAAMKTLLDTDDIQTLTGVSAGIAHLGTFTGSTIPDSSTIKAGMQSIETAIEGKQNTIAANTYQTYDANMIAWPAAISATEVQYLDGLPDTLVNLLGGKQAADGDLTDLADGSLTGSKVAGYAAATTSKATTYTIGTDSISESYGGAVYVTSATTITAPAVTAGMNFSVVTVGDIAVSLDVNAADKMILDGVTLADGDKATNSSKAGDTITCLYYSVDGWYCWSGTVLGGHWTDGN